MNDNALFIVYLYVAPPLLVLATITQYISLRIRNTHLRPQDPQLGRKAACYLFLACAELLILFGLSVSANDLFASVFDPAAAAATSGSFNGSQRLAAALVASGIIHGVIAIAVVRLFTNDRTFPAVRRAFIGQGFVLSGLVTMTVSTVALIAVFSEGPTDFSFLSWTLALGCVWGPTAALHLALLLWSGRGQPE